MYQKYFFNFLDTFTMYCIRFCINYNLYKTLIELTVLVSRIRRILWLVKSIFPVVIFDPKANLELIYWTPCLYRLPNINFNISAQTQLFQRHQNILAMQHSKYKVQNSAQILSCFPLRLAQTFRFQSPCLLHFQTPCLASKLLLREGRESTV
jgi:hypothetical protein